MKLKHPIAILFFLPFIGFSQLTDISSQLKENPGNLNAYIHEPFGKTAEKKPLVLVLHGCNQTADEIALGSGWNQLADSLGFFVLYPEQKTNNNLFRCFNWFLKDDQEKDKGEMASIYEMMQYAVSHYAVDPSRIYIYGVSAGAAMSVNFMACYPDKLKSGAILAGTAYKQVDTPMKSFSEMRKPTVFSDQELRQRLYSQDSLYSGEFPQLIVVHGTDDKVVNYGNGEVLVKQWKTAFKIVSESERKVNVNPSSPIITRKDFKDASGRSVIIFYTADNWGHYLMIDPGPEPKQGGEVTKHAKDGDFFSTYEIAKDWNLVK